MRSTRVALRVVSSSAFKEANSAASKAFPLRSYSDSLVTSSIFNTGSYSDSQPSTSDSRKVCVRKLHEQISDFSLVHKVAVLTHGPEPADLKNGHLLYWNKEEEVKNKDTGSYLFDDAVARSFREKHEVIMQLILEKEVDAKH